METVTCCERNGFADKAEQCKCGRLCPEGRVDLSAILTRRVAERDMLRQCCASGQADSRQIAAHIAAGELRLTEQDGGYECALPITYCGPEPKEPTDWQAVTLWAAVILCFAVVVALSIADPRDLSTIWPRLVALASF
jgi:hypothetical protein